MGVICLRLLDRRHTTIATPGDLSVEAHRKLIASRILCGACLSTLALIGQP
jgi:hypothetical protein